MPLSLFGQGKFVSLELSPNISGIKTPKSYEFGASLFSINYGVNYSFALKKHHLSFGLEHSTNRVAVTFNTYDAQSIEVGGVGSARIPFKTNGIVFDLGYGYELISRKKLKMIPYARVGMGYFYAAGLARDVSVQVPTTDNFTIVTRTADNFSPSLIEKVFYKWELGSKLIFSPDKKVSFIMTPYYSFASRLRDGTKSYSYRPWYTSAGIKFGVQLNF